MHTGTVGFVEQRLCVSAKVVSKRGDSFVLLAPAAPGATPERRIVKTGLTGGGRVQILEGLGGTEQVVRSTFDLPRRQAAAASPFMPRPPGRHP